MKDKNKVFFDSLNDEDFYSDKLNHIYFNDEVNEENINKLINEVRNANLTIKDEKNNVFISPKPICIHISSRGGKLYYASRFLTIFKESRVPICTLVDNYSASAATMLSVMSPYRVGTKYSFTLIHQYSGVFYGKKETMENDIKITDEIYSNLINVYLKKTKFNKKELSIILLHDKWLDYKTCLDKKIYDRVIDVDKKRGSSSLNIPFDILIKQTNLNNVYLNCENNNKEFDILLKSSEYTNPVIIYSKNINCYDDNGFYYLNNLSLINRIKSLKVPSYAIINTAISLDDLIPLLYCDKIYMFDNATVVLNMVNFKYNSILLADVIYNTELIINIIKNILIEKTKIPKEIIKDINNKLLILKPKECKKYKLCDEIIKLF